jgi:hypothetical protein
MSNLKQQPNPTAQAQYTTKNRDTSPILPFFTQNGGGGEQKTAQNGKSNYKLVDFEVLDASGLVGNGTSKAEQQAPTNGELWLPKNGFVRKFNPNSQQVSDRVSGHWEMPKDENPNTTAQRTIELNDTNAAQTESEAEFDFSQLLEFSDEEREAIAEMQKSEFPIQNSIALIQKKINLRKSIAAANKAGQSQKAIMLKKEWDIADAKLKELSNDKANFPNGLPSEAEVIDYQRKHTPMRRNKKGGEQ